MKKKKILVVDDDREVHELLRVLLKNDFDAVFSSNGEEAIKIVTHEPDIDIILMDGGMPVMDGWQAAEAIKEQYDIPIICISGNPIPEKHKPFFLAHSPKPFDIPEFMAYLKKTLT